METYQQLCTSAVVLEGAMARLESPPPEVRHAPRDRWLDALRELLSAHTLRRTSILEIACNSRDPEACAAVLNALVASYLEFIDENHRNAAAEIVATLDRERVDLERRITDDEQRLLEAKHQGGDLGIKEHSRYVHPMVQRVVQLNEALLEIQRRRAGLEASLAAVRRTAESGGDLRQHLLTLEPLVGKEMLLAALGLNGQESALAASTERELMEQQAELDALQQHFGPRHPRVVELAQKIQSGHQYLASFDRKLRDRLAGASNPQLANMLVGMVQQDLAQTKANEDQLRREYGQAEAEAIALNDRLANVTIIERDLELLRNMHAALVNRIENTDIHQNQADVRVSVIDEPVTPTAPVYPSLPRVLAVCLLLGSGLGVLIVYGMDVLDDRFRSPEELHEQLGLPVLAMVRKHPVRDEAGIGALQLHVAPGAAESEAFRTLRTALALSRESLGRVAVTSSEPADGKTTVVANLGVAYAQVGKRTLVIDGDLRRPGLTTLFQMRSRPGLSDLLRSDDDVAQLSSECICPSGLERLDILPCGPRPSDPAELLSRERFSDLLGWAETLYDQILIDSPPVLAASDVAILGRLVDGVLVVVQPHKNHRRRVLRAVESLASLGVSLAGAVVNGVASETDAGYYGYAGDYEYGYGYGCKGGSAYGHEEGYDNPVDSTPEDESGPSAQDDSPIPEGTVIPFRRRAA
jgi:capsular exopolysaccharide synthesis family protein